MSWIKYGTLKNIFIILAAGIALLLFLDNLFGYAVLKHVPVSSRNNTERGIRISHPVYHHTLSGDYDGLARNQSEYRFCTNSDGLKSKCDAVSNDKEIDIGFLGDSFTEGLGLPYEKTFVGLIAEKLPQVKIANLGVVSYAPTIYYMKLKDLLDKGYRFRELVVYIDISDIQDEANYAIVDGKVVETIEDTSKQKMFPVAHFGVKRLRDRLGNEFGILQRKQDIHEDYLDLTDPIYRRNYNRTAWTYNDSIDGYGKLAVKGSIDKSVTIMEKLYDLCKTNSIKLSIAVFPWPGQILYDVEESRQVKIWRDFCVGKCTNFYNSFPTFFDLIKSSSKKEVIEKYYFYGDMHFNESGNQLIAADFLKIYQRN
jgi:hypothetical protein